MKMLLSKCDVAQAAAVERRRRFDEERRDRIFNPRRRLIGIDKDALDQQIRERKEKEVEEKNLNEAYDLIRIQNDKVALYVEQSLMKERRRLNQDINEFRSTFQGPNSRRENEIPARVEEEPIFGISSGQSFPGEDLCSQTREKAQKEQNRAWLEQQMLEKKKEEWDKKATEKSFDELMIAMDRRACDIENLERQCRRQLNESVKQYNKFLADERTQNVNNERKKEDEDKRAEICHSMLGDLLCENRNVHQSNLGPHRVIGAMYKGMSEEERMAYRTEQQKQIQEKIRQREEEAKREAEWNQLAQGLAYNAFVKDMEREQRRRQQQRELVQQNQILSEEQKERQKFLDKYVYTTNLTDEFYRQFNTTTR